MPNVGIIGLGFMGRNHLITLRKLGRAKVVAVADRNPDNLRSDRKNVGNIEVAGQELASLDGVETFSDSADLLRHPDVDIVVIALPTHLHKACILAAIDAGKHIMCEKPMVRSVDEGREVLAALQGYDKFFFVGHCIRFWPAYAKAAEIMRSGDYGRVISAHFFRTSPMPTWSWQNWMLDASQGGGGILDLHIHDVDFANYVFGRPDAVHAYGGGVNGGISDVTAIFEYADGPKVSIEGGWLYHPTYPFRMAFRVLMERATLDYNSRIEDKLHIHTAEGKDIVPDLPAGDGYLREHEYFLDCVRDNCAPTVVTPDSSLEAIELVQREMDSMRATAGQ